jgi:hypothetical protein
MAEGGSGPLRGSRLRLVTLGRWQQVLVDALHNEPAIAVRTVVADHLNREPTRAELTAARRAAHHLKGFVRPLHIPAPVLGSAGSRHVLVLVRVDTKIDPDQLRRVALGSTAAEQPGPGDAVRTTEAVQAAETAARLLRGIHPQRLDPTQTDEVAGRLEAASQELLRVSRQLRRLRGPDDEEFGPGDEAWQERWNSVLAYRERTGRGPSLRVDEPDVAPLERWVAHQRQEYRRARLSTARRTAMSAAGFDFAPTGQPQFPEETERAMVDAYRAGESLREVAAQQGVGVDTVRRRVIAAGLTVRPARRKPSVPDAELVRLRNAGKTGREIGEIVGMKPHAVLKRLSRAQRRSEAQRSGPHA